MRGVCIVLVNILVNVIVAERVKPKSVNLALETVLRFDKQNHDADVEVIKKVQKFLDTVKSVMTDYNGGRRYINVGNIKLTDFIRESARILKTYNDDDLEDVFTGIHNELRKYHYKGCKFYELVQNHDVRRFMTNKLEQVKGTPAATLRKYLDKVVTTIDKNEFDGKDRFLVDLLNSLYSGASDVFRRTINGLKVYRARGSGTMLSDFIAGVLRSLLFDHYSNLNENARSQVKHVVQHYWITTNGDDNPKSNENNNQRLKVIDVNKFNNQGMHQWSKFLKNGLRTTSTPISYYIINNQHQESKKPLKQQKTKQKVTGVTVKTTLQADSKDSSLKVTDSRSHKKRSKRVKFYPAPKTLSLEYEIFLNQDKVKELKLNTDNPKILSKKKHKKGKATTQKEIIDKSESESSFEISIMNIKHERENNGKNKVYTETASDTEISKSIENRPKDKFKADKVKLKKKSSVTRGLLVTSYYGHTLKSNEDFMTDDSENLGTTEKNSLSEEHHSFGNGMTEVAMDPTIGLLTGGQNIDNMNYRAKKQKKTHRKNQKLNKTVKRVDDSKRPIEIFTEHSAVINVELPIQNWKIFTPVKPAVKKTKLPLRSFVQHNNYKKPHQHRRRRKLKNLKAKPKKVRKVEFETAEDFIESRKSFTASKKHESNEGMTIESFENENLNKTTMTTERNKSNQYTRIENDTSNKVESLFNKLQLQIKNVQKQIELLQKKDINQTAKAKGEGNSSMSFRAATFPTEETTTKYARTSSATTTKSKTVNTTTKHETTVTPTVSADETATTPASVETESPSPETVTGTSSSTKMAPIFRSQDIIEKIENPIVSNDETEDTNVKSEITTIVSNDKTEGANVTSEITTSEVSRSTTSDNLADIENLVASNEVKPTDEVSTTEKSDSLLQKMMIKNPLLKKLKDLPRHSENKVNATKRTTVKQITTQSKINISLKDAQAGQRKEAVKTKTTKVPKIVSRRRKQPKAHASDLNKVDPKLSKKSQRVTQTSTEKLNSTKTTDINDWDEMDKEFGTLGDDVPTKDPLMLGDDAFKSLEDTIKI